MTLTETSWQPSASIEHLKARAELMQRIRLFFTSREYLEVETPIMSRYGVTDVHLANINAQFRGNNYFLQTSPEYAMKRLLAAGSGSIFQLARVFRDDELGRWHNPEFTLLEWYRLDTDHHGLMTETEALLQDLLHCPALVKKTYQESFADYCQLDPLSADVNELKQVLKRFALDNVLPENETDKDAYLFLLMSHVVEPELAKIEAPVAVHGFPPSQAALAKIDQGQAERFEIYYQGVELANGFHELTDVNEQKKRFEQDRLQRRYSGKEDMAVDPRFLNALASGLPPCSGVALGVDRLLALALGAKALSEVLAFDFERC